MEPFHYLLVLGACLAITAPLEWGIGARVYRRPVGSPSPWSSP